ncbi:hypothetical protein EHQ43_10295 [Leptospira bouyouniensis]|uniref:Uncharacterized protein n=1 Tax=Leptospira bouyouniensis TaxID=2484911 RepID=A0A7I0HS07_9LEPT|nr:hypothetical protein [Leptospira bouyouniensis]TGL05021.1 hypothetical protein EHQ43_10295 [Leptospira bouyouniensis]
MAFSNNSWDKYQEARTKVDQFLNTAKISLRDSLELLASERSKINKQLIAEWAYKTQKSIPDFHTYVDLSKTSDKLGKAYDQYWHYVFLYRALYENKNNIIPSKVYSFELYFLNKERVLCKSNPHLFTEADDPSLNQSKKLFYTSPLGHFIFFKFTKEYVAKFPVIYPMEEIFTEALFQSFSKITDANAAKFITFFQENNSNELQPNTFRNFIESDSHLKRLFEIIDVGFEEAVKKPN